MSLASDPLPTDPDALRAFAETLQAELARKDVEIAAHAAEIHAKTLYIEKLKMQPAPAPAGAVRTVFREA